MDIKIVKDKLTTIGTELANNRELKKLILGSAILAIVRNNNTEESIKNSIAKLITIMDKDAYYSKDLSVKIMEACK
jgi:hypothetical protein